VTTTERKSGGSYLVAAYVSRSKLNEDDLKEFLAQFLPAHAIPEVFLHFNRFPVTLSGKVDSRAILDSQHICKVRVGARCILEEELLRIWEDSLGLNSGSTGIHDNFFQLGGDSVIAIQIVSRIREQTGYILKTGDISQLLTVGRITDAINDSYFALNPQKQNKKESLTRESMLLPSNIESVFPASSLLEGFLHHALWRQPTDISYNLQSSWVYNEKLDVDKLRGAWLQMIQKYASFRLGLNWDDGIVQMIYRQGKLDWRYYENSDKMEDILEADLRETYDLSLPSLFRVYIFKGRDGFRCVLSAEHSILDGWSMAPLLHSLHSLYFSSTPNSEVSVQKLLQKVLFLRYLFLILTFIEF
jgi:acyl carrier protein